MKQIKILVPEDVYDRLVKEALEDDRPLAKYVGRMLAGKGLKPVAQVAGGWARVAPVIQNVGPFQQGPTSRPGHKSEPTQWQISPEEQERSIYDDPVEDFYGDNTPIGKAEQILKMAREKFLGTDEEFLARAGM